VVYPSPSPERVIVDKYLRNNPTVLKKRKKNPNQGLKSEGKKPRTTLEDSRKTSMFVVEFFSL